MELTKLLNIWDLYLYSIYNRILNIQENFQQIVTLCLKYVSLKSFEVYDVFFSKTN